MRKYRNMLKVHKLIHEFINDWNKIDNLSILGDYLLENNINFGDYFINAVNFIKYDKYFNELLFAIRRKELANFYDLNLDNIIFHFTYSNIPMYTKIGKYGSRTNYEFLGTMLKIDHKYDTDVYLWIAFWLTEAFSYYKIEYNNKKYETIIRNWIIGNGLMSEEDQLVLEKVKQM